MGAASFLKFIAPGASIPRPVGSAINYGQGSDILGSIASAILDPISTPFDKPAGALPMVYSKEQEEEWAKEDKEQEEKNKKAKEEWLKHSPYSTAPNVGTSAKTGQHGEIITEAIERIRYKINNI